MNVSKTEGEGKTLTKKKVLSNLTGCDKARHTHMHTHARTHTVKGNQMHGESEVLTERWGVH